MMTALVCVLLGVLIINGGIFAIRVGVNLILEAITGGSK